MNDDFGSFRWRKIHVRLVVARDLRHRVTGIEGNAVRNYESLQAEDTTTARYAATVKTCKEYFLRLTARASRTS